MALSNGYTDLITFKQNMFTEPQDTLDDAYIEAVIHTVSRWIDRYCSRRFYRNTVDETRYYTASEPSVLYTDDIGSVTTLKTDEDGDRTYEITWAATDYDLLPYNAALYSNPLPYTWIRITPLGSYVFPLTIKGVQIVGTFGYCTLANCPPQISQACLIQSMRLFKRKDTPLGIAGTPGVSELRLIPQLDADVQMLLYQFIAAM